MRFLIFILLVTCHLHVLRAQEEATADTVVYEELSEQEQPWFRTDSVSGKPLDSAAWKSLTKDLNYDDEDFEKEENSAPPEKMNEFNWNQILGFDFKATQYVLFAIVIALLAFLLYTLLKPFLTQPTSKKVRPEAGYAILHDDEQMMQSDLAQLLQAALAQQDYKSAIRIAFLHSLQSLQAEHKIQWSKEKTNRSYLQELRELDAFVPFGAMITLYEKAWYGDQHTGKEDFETFETFRKQLISS